jgi:hypothetical protein
MKAKIIYTLKELKEITNSFDGTISYWPMGYRIHDGHRHLLKLCKEKTDYVIGVYLNNWYRMQQIVFDYYSKADPEIHQETINEMSEKTNVVFIYTGNYFGFSEQDSKKLLNIAIEQLPNSEIPEYIHQNKQLISSLRTAQVQVSTFKNKIRFHYHCGSMKDAWRPVYVDWYRKTYPETIYDLIDPILDSNGNSFTASVPDDIKQQITHPLLIPGMRTIEEVKEYNKDIPGLEVAWFHYDPNTKYLNARFQTKTRWWNFGVKEN